jgi:hypothetical protein
MIAKHLHCDVQGCSNEVMLEKPAQPGTYLQLPDGWLALSIDFSLSEGLFACPNHGIRVEGGGVTVPAIVVEAHGVDPALIVSEFPTLRKTADDLNGLGYVMEAGEISGIVARLMDAMKDVPPRAPAAPVVPLDRAAVADEIQPLKVLADRQREQGWPSMANSIDDIAERLSAIVNSTTPPTTCAGGC